MKRVNLSLTTDNTSNEVDYKSKTSETTVELAEALRNIRQLSTQSFGQSNDRVDVISGKIFQINKTGHVLVDQCCCLLQLI